MMSRIFEQFLKPLPYCQAFHQGLSIYSHHIIFGLDVIYGRPLNKIEILKLNVECMTGRVFGSGSQPFKVRYSS